ncbi:hypothetical protein [Streptosporangium sp. NPDC051022]|uniref:hypothetical protein n=1 Tax=Streptosporangium sp. NPDC051022 TaxID=3155752 RepID=UPI00343C0953
MSTHEAQQPIYEVRCNHDGCTATFTPETGFSSRFARQARHAAKQAGWDVPPPYGKGSRSPLDFCPEHVQRRPR